MGMSVCSISAVRANSNYLCRQRKYKTDLHNSEAYARFVRDTDQYDNDVHAFLISLQPVPAIVALLGCLCIFAFGSATWWYSHITAGKFFIAYAAQVIVLAIFVCLKTIRYRRTKSFWPERLTAFAGFSEDLDNLVGLIRKDDGDDERSRSGSVMELARRAPTANHEAAASTPGAIGAGDQSAQGHS